MELLIEMTCFLFDVSENLREQTYVNMYGGDLGAGGGGNWKAPDDPSLVVGGKDDVSIALILIKLL